MYKLLIIASLAAATCGFPATGVDHPGLELDSVDPLELQEDSTSVAARPKRCLSIAGVISVCKMNNDGTRQIANEILEIERTDVEAVVDGLISLATALAKAGNH